MKRVPLKLLLTSALASVFSISLVSAQTDAFGAITSSINNIVTNLLTPIVNLLLGGTGVNSGLLFARILFFLIVFGIVWVALSRVGFFADYTWVLVVVSFSASILAIRFVISDALVNTIILPYSVLGVALTAGLPFVLYFLVVNVGMQTYSSFVRKAAWIFFGVVFLFLWFARYDELSTQSASYVGWIYPVTALLALIMTFMDGTFRRWLAHAEMQKAGMSSVEAARVDIRRRIGQLNQDLASNIITADEHRRMVRDLKKRLEVLEKA